MVKMLENVEEIINSDANFPSPTYFSAKTELIAPDGMHAIKQTI
jgi:hypothetical protein